jgi:hypothetical protein
MLITSEDMARMLKNYWFPACKAINIRAQILLFDVNWNSASLAEPLLKDEAIRTSPFGVTRVASRRSKSGQRMIF